MDEKKERKKVLNDCIVHLEEAYNLYLIYVVGRDDVRDDVRYACDDTFENMIAKLEEEKVRMDEE